MGVGSLGTFDFCFLGVGLGLDNLGFLKENFSFLDHIIIEKYNIFSNYIEIIIYVEFIILSDIHKKL